MHQAQIHAESVLFVCPALSFVKSPLHFHHAALQGGHFVFWFRIPPGLNLSEIHARGRDGLQPGASIDSVPPWGPPQSRPRRWEFRTAKCESRLRRSDFSAAKCESRPPHPDFFTAKRESRPRRPDFFAAKRESRPPRPDFSTAKCESRPRRPDFFTAKHESRPPRPEFATAKHESRLRRSPLPGRGFFGRAAGRNGALPYNARKSQFLRNGDVWATESLFLFAVLWLAFLPDQSETGVAGGGKARRPETPAAPRRPAQRPRPAPGFCAASANTRPGDPPQSACSRRPSGCPQRPNLSARRRADSPKRKGK